jgi:hypothetical protein
MDCGRMGAAETYLGSPNQLMRYEDTVHIDLKPHVCQLVQRALLRGLGFGGGQLSQLG